MIDEQLKDVTLSGLRMQRDLMIADTDWAGLSDIPTALATEALVYRQGLRDLPYPL